VLALPCCESISAVLVTLRSKPRAVGALSAWLRRSATELAAASGRAAAPASPAMQRRLLQLHKSRRKRNHRSPGCHSPWQQWSGCRECCCVCYACIVLCCAAVVICCHSARRRWSQAAQLIVLWCCVFTVYCGVPAGVRAVKGVWVLLHPTLHAVLSLAVSAKVRICSILSVACVIQSRCCARSPTAPVPDPLGRNLGKHRALSYACNRYLPWCGSTWHSL
jgi:hypothetical protein